MSTTTTNYAFIKPAVNNPTDQDLWGGYLNTNLDTQDALIKTVSDQANKASPAVNAQTADYTVIATDQNKLITVDATAGNKTITLLAAATAGSGFRVAVKKIDASANTVTVDANGAETIDGSLTFVLSNQYEAVMLVCNGTTWFIEDNFIQATTVIGDAVSLYQTVGTVLTITTWVTLLFDTEEYDDKSWHSTSVNTGRITADFSGRLNIIGTVDYGFSAGSAITAIRLLKNGSVIKHGMDFTSTANGTGNIVLQISGNFSCVSTDYFELQAYTNTASPTSGTGISGTSLQAFRTK